ncbi:MAG: 3-hydroxybutyrate dehydrogenase [Actinobacteria bacterium]|nr:3-hydroxybutyrate dehydrogenase [Actinomycetota bacterium]
MSQKLTGKRALITGSFQGIGLGIATAFASEGVEIVLHGLATPAVIAAAEATVLAAGASKVESHVTDLRDSSETEELITALLKDGPIDILVNNAGIQHTAPIEEMSREKWNDVIAINLSSYFDTMRLLLPQMRERGFGRVINVASVHGLVASVSKSPYVAAKHAVVGLTKVAALEYADAGSAESGGVTVNAICPGWVETALIEPQIQLRVEKFGGDRVAGVADLLSEKQPSRRLSTTGDIGELALWLCNRAAHNITGTAIPIDGGWTAQ